MDRHQRIREKYERDQAHIDHLISKGWSSFEISAQMTHFMIVAMREGVKLRHPYWSDELVLAEMRRKVLFDEKMQKRRGLRQRDEANEKNNVSKK